MSSVSSSSDGDTKVYKLRSRRHFPIWKQKILSAASSKGYDKFLTSSVAVKTEMEIDAKEVDYINEVDDKQRRIKKGELNKMKNERKKSLAAAQMLTSSVRSKDIKMLASCKLDPKRMFDKICKKYGSEEDTDLSDLLNDFNECVLKSKKKDPEDWYAELDQINEQLEAIDVSFSKGDKEMAAHILSSLPKGYKSVKTVIQMDDNYLDDVTKVKKQIVKHWKANFRKKSRRSKHESSSDSESSESSSDESRKHRKNRKGKKDELALNVENVKQDSRNPYGVIVCGQCGRPGHGIASCWDIHGKPQRNTNGNNNGTPVGNERAQRRCWICGSGEHLAYGCPNKHGNGSNNNKSDNDDEQINSLFVGTITMQFECKVKGWKKERYNCHTTPGTLHTKKNCTAKSEIHEASDLTSDEEYWYDANDEMERSVIDDQSTNDELWCRTCQMESDDGGSDGSNESSTRNLIAEEEIKKMLGLLRNDEDRSRTAMYDLVIENLEENKANKNDDGSYDSENEGMKWMNEAERDVNTSDEELDEGSFGSDGVLAIYTEMEVNAVDNDDEEWETWLADTGASCHVTNHDTLLIDEESDGGDKIIVGDKRRCSVDKKGTIILTAKDDSNVILTNVRVVKEIGKQIISIGTLLRDGGTMTGSGNWMKVTVNGATLTFTRNKVDGLYYMKARRVPSIEECNNHEIKVNKEGEWTKVEAIDKKKWPKMSRDEAHQKWGHPHYDQMNKMANYNKVRLTGKLSTCAGCAIIKSRAMKTTRTCSKPAKSNGERLFIDTTGPYPKSRGGMRYWMCAVDDRSDKTWTHFAASKNHMVAFVKNLVTEINGLGLKVRYIRCDNAGEHQEALKKYCLEIGIVLEYTAPNTPQQNGRVEKKIHILWQRAMTMMANANLTVESQSKFWAEAVACSNYLEDLMIKAGRTDPSLAAWTEKNITKWFRQLVQFGRIGVVNKKEKISAKMKEKGFPAMMVGYAMQHGPGVYRLYNPATNRIIFSRDVAWMDYKPKSLEESFGVYEPGIGSTVTEAEIRSGENEMLENGENAANDADHDDNNEMSIQEVSNTSSSDESRSSNSDSSSDDSSISSNSSMTDNNEKQHISISSDSSTTTVSKQDESNVEAEVSSSSEESKSSNDNTTSTRASKLTKLSRSRASCKTKPVLRRSLRVKNKRETQIPVPTVKIPRAAKQQANRSIKSQASIKSIRSKGSTKKKSNVGRKHVTGDTVAKRVRIFTGQDEGESGQDVNLVSEYHDDPAANRLHCFDLSQQSIDRIYNAMQPDEEVLLNIYTMELSSDPETPTTIRQALKSKDNKLWRASAIAEINNFLKRKSWRFILKKLVQAMKRKPIGVKWVFKIKHEPDYSLRYKSRVVTKGYMQIPGIDYSEKFSPVAQATTVRVVLTFVLWYRWGCELVDIEAAFLEGRLLTPAYIELPPGMVELGFMTQEEFDNTCIELQGGMYGNVDAALLYFIRFTEFAISKEGLNLTQSKSDPCLFFRKNEEGRTVGVIVIYVDDCVIAGENEFMSEMKNKLKTEFGVVEDGRLRKLLGVRYKWEDLDDDENARVVMSMDDKAQEVIDAYEKVTGLNARVQNTPGKPGEALDKNAGPAVKQAEYRSVLGKLMFYVTKISPECSYACGQLARHMHCPGEQHWDAMGRLIGYLKGKSSHELVIRRPLSLKIVSFGDASYGDCVETRHSSTGDLHTIGGSIVSWRSQKTRFVCLSSAEAEYVALTEMCKEQRFLSMLMGEVFECDLPSIIHEDNEAATYLAKNLHVSARTKHIDIRVHYVREHLKSKQGVIVPVKSEDNFADILTKNTPVKIFQRLGKAIINGFRGFENKFLFSNNQRENI